MWDEGCWATCFIVPKASVFLLNVGSMVSERGHGGSRRDKQKIRIDSITSDIIVQTVQDDEDLIQKKIPGDTISPDRRV